jgi:protein-disulfide isomerase
MNMFWRKAAAAFAVTGIAATIASCTQGEASPPADRSAIEAVVHDYILAHPEIIPEAMERLQAKQTTAAIDANRRAIETPFAGAWAGNPKGDVTLVEYFDYACGFCRASVADVDRLLAEDRGVKIVFRELPILSEESTAAAKLSLVAAQQGRFYDFHKAVYAGGQLSDASLAAAAARAGVKAPAASLGLPAIASEIAANIDMARALRLSGTPSFIVGDQILNGAVGYDALRKAVADARAAKRS